MRPGRLMVASLCVTCVGCANAWSFPDLQADGGAGSDSGTTDACPPKDMTNFQPHWVPPIPAHQGMCTQAQVDGFASACLGSSATMTMCNQFGVSYAACYGCLPTKSTASEYGPLVVYQFPGFDDDDVNIGGCIAAAQSDTSGTGCGGSVAASDECEREACNICGSYPAFATCVEVATTGTCGSWVQAATTCGGALTGAAVECVPGTTGIALFESVATVMCGP